MEKTTMEVLNGNRAASYGVILSKPHVIAAYPITPQTPLIEYIAQAIADGELDAKSLEVESEHSAMSALEGASLAGARTFTATSSQGLAYMYEPVYRASTLRLPIVMNIANREMDSPQTLWCGHSDSVGVRSAGWIQFYAENNQEILDTTIQAFKIAESKAVLLPVMVCYDGFFLSHSSEPVEIPNQNDVDSFLPPYQPNQAILDPENPMAIDPLTPSSLLTSYRYKQVKAMEASKEVIKNVNKEYYNKFGRNYHGLIEAYKCEDAEAILVTTGSMTGTARYIVDKFRLEGNRLGLIKLRVLSPFPAEELVKHTSQAKAIGVIDRHVQFYSGTGTAYLELKSALYDHESQPIVIAFIAGLGGAEIGIKELQQAAKTTLNAAKKNEKPKENIWLNLQGGSK